MNWKNYLEKTKDRTPSKLLDDARWHTTMGHALDFGAGSLVDSKFLLDQGFYVTALDAESIGTIDCPSFAHVYTTFEEFEYPKNMYTLIHGRFAFPFIRKEEFPRVWDALFDSLKDGGILTGEFFGVHDDWALDPQKSLSEPWEGETNILFHTIADVSALLSKYSIILLEEKEYDKPFVLGSEKHWHVISFIAKK